MSEGQAELPSEQIGAIITSGPADWQIIQREADGWGRLALAGRWVSPEAGVVEARLVNQDTAMPVSQALDWQPAETQANGSWAMTLERVPAGGLYRLETRFNRTSNPAGEWSDRGDIRHYLGVGDLWVIAGQSNSAGYGRGPVYDPPELGLHQFRSSMQWALATHPMNESTDTRHTVNREGGNPGHSPYLHFARLLKQALGYPIGLIPTSLGGSALARWNPTEPAPSGELYQNMLRCIQAAGGRVKGIVWYQGETDANPELAPSYLERFTRTVAAWRAALGNPELPVITVQLNRVYEPSNGDNDRGWSLIREVQRQAARVIPSVAVVPALDLPLSDVIHNSPAGNMLLGERMARAALGTAYGQPIAHRAPDLESATSTDGQRITLTFANVSSRMENIDPTANSFKVEDSQGNVPIGQVVYPGGAQVQLVLGRALAGPAVVHGGYGVAPATVPLDMERMMPMLGFFQAPVMGAGGGRW